MGEACSAHGGDKKIRLKFWLESIRGSDYSESLAVGGRIILKWIWGNRVWGIDWIHLAQDRARCRALVNTVMNLWVPRKAGNFLTS
jgi:hypothetical protein